MGKGLGILGILGILGVLGIARSAPLRATVPIAAVVCSATDTELTLEFRSSGGPIEKYQRAEVVGNQIIVRIVDAVIPEIPPSASCVDNLSIKAEQIREFAVFRIHAPAYDGDITVKRLSPTSIALVVNKTSASARTSAPATSAAAPSASKKWKLDVIVIDAGHGGKDAGAKGVNGVYEKTVTLALAQRLRDLIVQKLPGTKVVMTRDDDTFVELHRRTKIANNANGKLFVSIHCNSMPTIPHPARGCETYILRPGRNEDAARVAATENASIALEQAQSSYTGLTEEELIVATMAQRSFVRFSEAFASLVQQHAPRYTGLKNRGVNQAGFLVLVGASMPNILFETAFLSNPDDARIISSKEGQEQMAQAMLQAIKDYAELYQSTLDN